ncbi:MAG TPA: tetratricopeptide repeat protein [Quisquiliibacterium sp.]|nr:tetratricopeptide repeat protein [Quisquiliibacterium sp.]HQD81888.1 tetratricopeptide repeat protein [Quisquiliibacterium sp.]HQN13003.1 tetratricopeptide repeat protein [Quisquiliibacterium sp.]HQP65404.1 tetratricopeptide repeat protein [Quisquiliibacterium sp.]
MGIGVALTLAWTGPAVAQSGAAAPLPGERTGAPVQEASTAAAPSAAAPSAVPAAPLQSDPRQSTTVAAQASRLLREGKPEDALRTLDDALKRAPRDPQLRFVYGVALAEAGRTKDASEVFEQMTQDFPELPEPYNNLAVMYAASGELDRARTALENAVRALPDYPLGHENLGDVYLRMAARAYEKAGTLDPRSAGVKDKLTLTRELLRRVAPVAARSAPAGAAPAGTR